MIRIKCHFSFKSAVKSAVFCGAFLVLGACSLSKTSVELPRSEAANWESEAVTRLAEISPERFDAATFWDQFDNPTLTGLIAEANRENLTLQLAALRILDARLRVRGAQLAQGPQPVIATATGGYAANALAGGRIVDNDFLFGDLGISSAWEIDVFGRLARAKDASRGNLGIASARAQDASLLITSEVARRYFALQTARLRLRIAEENLAKQERSTEIAQNQFRFGVGNELDVAQARAQAVATSASLALRREAIERELSALAVLVGRLPGELEVPEFPLRLPDDAALSAPGSNLLLRPDVRAAALAVNVEAARLDISRAQLKPGFVIAGSLGLTRTTSGGLTNAITENLAGALRVPLFDFGRLRNAVALQDVRLEQAIVRYEQTVLEAADEINVAAIALLRAREERLARKEALAIANRSLELAQLRYREGLSDLDRVLRAQEAVLRQADAQAIALAREASAMTQLYRNLAGAELAGPVAPTRASTKRMEKRGFIQNENLPSTESLEPTK